MMRMGDPTLDDDFDPSVDPSDLTVNVIKVTFPIARKLRVVSASWLLAHVSAS